MVARKNEKGKEGKENLSSQVERRHRLTLWRDEWTRI